jgi:eukaryotic-like serine/threonine-protein kinase
VSALLLRVEKGPRRGMELRYAESDDLVVGRDAPGSSVPHMLDPEDRSVSRHHCILELRPPHCIVRDLGSKNGTEVRRAGEQRWRRVKDWAELGDHDQIRVGQTVLSITIADDDGEQQSPIRCIRCMQPLSTAPPVDAGVVRAQDYLCEQCRVKRAAAPEPHQEPELQVGCAGCAADVSGHADCDGRARELARAATYLCPDCAERDRALMHQDVGGYLLLSQVGVGGMGVVYRVWHPETYRVAALKQVLKPLRVPEDKVRRFLREVALLQRLEHANIIRMFEAGQVDDVPYFVSEYLPDGNLAQFISPDGEPLLSAQAATRLMAGALLGVAHAHAFGVVHRDLKPENVILRRDAGTVVPKVADFGLSRSYEEHGGTITGTGEFAGTLPYLPPEQRTDFRGCRPPVDVYAMGVCLYYLLTGRYPVELPTPWQLEKHRTSLVRQDLLPAPYRAFGMVMNDARIPVRERRPDLPAALAEVVDHAVQRDAGRRIQSVQELRARLLAAVGGDW